MTEQEAIKWLETFKGRYGLAELEEAVDTAIQALSSIYDGMIIYASEGCKGVQIHVLKENTVTIFAGYIDRQMEYSEWVLRKYGKCGMIFDKLITDDDEPDGTGGQIFCP